MLLVDMGNSLILVIILFVIPCSFRSVGCYECSENGLKDALSTSGSIATFDCYGPQTIQISSTMQITQDFSIDGGYNLTIEYVFGDCVNMFGFCSLL